MNPVLQAMEVYASKEIARRARANPAIADLSFGQPSYGPPPHLLKAIEQHDLSISSFLAGAKRYEDARGSAALRQAIAEWYRARYGIGLDPDSQIMVTHGAAEALALAILATTGEHDRVAVCDPSYMLYARSVALLGRQVKRLKRPANEHEYAAIMDGEAPLDARAFIINSPENPTGYVASAEDWERIGAAAAISGTWIIHDEAYDIMDFDRPHIPAMTVASLADNTILVNSISKKYGVPGLRIGWLIAPPGIIELAAKAHDYLYLGVSILSECVALRMLRDGGRSQWLEMTSQQLQQRRQHGLDTLHAAIGYAWPRQPLGAMFLFPQVRAIYQRMPEKYRGTGTVGAAVANFLLEEHQVAAVPGSVYGSEGNDHIRLVLCGPDDVFTQAMRRLGRLWTRHDA